VINEKNVVYLVYDRSTGRVLSKVEGVLYVNNLQDQNLGVLEVPAVVDLDRLRVDASDPLNPKIIVSGAKLRG